MKNSATRDTLYALLKGAAIAAGNLSLVVLALMAIGYIQLASLDPLNILYREVLTGEYRQNPQDEAVKEELRALDLLARKAYFIRQSQITAGGYILAGSLIVTLASFVAMLYLKKKVRGPEWMEPLRGLRKTEPFPGVH